VQGIFSVSEMTKVLGVPIALVIRQLGIIEGERNVSEKQNDKEKLIEKMRTNTDKQNRKIVALPWRRSRIKMQKGRPTDGSEKQK
jgi:hypothetical protein